MLLCTAASKVSPPMISFVSVDLAEFKECCGREEEKLVKSVEEDEAELLRTEHRDLQDSGETPGVRAWGHDPLQQSLWECWGWKTTRRETHGILI